jgi:hypothetical protein
MDDIVVTSWNELNDRLFAGTWNEHLRRVRPTAVYRGLASRTWDLATGLMRLGPGYPALETPILRAFRKYAPHGDIPGDSEWGWLALAQHRGLPTHLPDWTYLPYVALHFVTENALVELAMGAATNGAVWSVDLARVHEHLPDALKAILDRDNSYAFTAEMLGEAASSLEAFDGLAPAEFVAFFEPSSLDERIVNQFALFSFMSHPRANAGQWLTLDQWLQRRPDLYRRTGIPAALKPQARDILDQINITERVRYPGLDGLSRWLRRYYTPTPE